MIPFLNELGYPPPGLHRATLEELEERFGRESEVRRAQMESLRWLADAARRAGVKRLVVNGSFVTDAIKPNDVDCVLLIDATFPLDPHAQAELAVGFPFLDVDLVYRAAFDDLVDDTFATDRDMVPKGMIEVSL